MTGYGINVIIAEDAGGREAAVSSSPILGSCGSFKRCDVLLADDLHSAAEFLDAFPQPGQLLVTDPVVLGIARLHIGFLKLFEASTIGACVARPSVDEARINSLGLRPEEAEIVNVRCVESADQQHAVVQKFRSLMEVERCWL